MQEIAADPVDRSRNQGESEKLLTPFGCDRIRQQAFVTTLTYMGATFEMKHWIRLAALALLAGILAVAAPAYAQEGTAASQGPAGISILILLLGGVAIVLVGLVYIAQSRDTRGGTHDDEEE